MEAGIVNSPQENLHDELSNHGNKNLKKHYRILKTKLPTIATF